MLAEHGSFTSAYYSTLLRLHAQADWIEPSTNDWSTAKGKRYKELVADGFALTNPVDRMQEIKAREFSIQNAVALSVFCFSGYQETQWMQLYNTRAGKFADDGEYMIGAHGYRMRGQLQQAARLLKYDRRSRRAMVTVYSQDDIFRNSKDVPCVATLHFAIRKNSLDLMVHMRSQSAIFVMPYDVFSFTVIQELMAMELGCSIGRYYHMCNSLHYFESEEPMMEKILAEGMPAETTPIGFFPVPATLKGVICDSRERYFDYIADKLTYYKSRTAEQGAAEAGPLLPRDGGADGFTVDMRAPASGGGDHHNR